MTGRDLEELRARVDRLERERDGWRRHTWRAAAVCALLAAVVLGAARPAPPVEPPEGVLADSVLRVRGLVVVDAGGVERVVIGAPVPDPLIYGRRSARLGTPRSAPPRRATPGRPRCCAGTTAWSRRWPSWEPGGRLATSSAGTVCLWSVPP